MSNNVSSGIEPSAAGGMRRMALSLRARTLLFIGVFLALAISVTVLAMSWNAREIAGLEYAGISGANKSCIALGT